MKNFLRQAFFPICLIFMLLFSIIAMSLNRGFYNSQYAANDTPLYTGLSLEDLAVVTDNLLWFLVGQREDLDMEMSINGEVREVFDEREKTHMVDVQKLYLTVVYITIGLFAAAAIALVALCKTKREEDLQSVLFSLYKKSLVVTGALVAILGAVFCINFNWFWTNFHLVFFSNDLWILDPAVSVMINMFPLDFFFCMCRDILLCFFGANAMVYIALMPKKYLLKNRKNNSENNGL